MPTIPVRQATALELAQARMLRIQQVGREISDSDISGNEITVPDIGINYDAIRDSIRSRRDTHRPFPMQLCADCGVWPALQMSWRPWHPAFVFLCGSCRSRIIVVSHRAALRRAKKTGRPLADVFAIVLSEYMRWLTIDLTVGESE